MVRVVCWPGCFLFFGEAGISCYNCLIGCLQNARLSRVSYVFHRLLPAPLLVFVPVCGHPVSLLTASTAPDSL
jgi:hypothetical protein